MVKGKLLRNKIFFIIIFITSCVSKNVNNTFYKGTLGLKIDEVKNIYKYEESAGNNEGFFVSIDTFSTRHKLNYINEEFPTIGERSKNWSVERWRKVPLLNSEKKLEVLLKYDIRNKEVKSKVAQIISLINSNTDGYYCYFYKIEGETIYSIELYLIDTKRSLIYTVTILT